jgi:hypothetical protein
VNVKGIEGTLVTRAKVDAIQRGQTLTQWVTEAMEGRLQNGNGQIAGLVGASNLPRVRSGVHDEKGDGRTRDTRARAVQRPPNNPPIDLGPVGRGAPQDSGVESASEKRWLGPPHMKGCGCKQCKEK